MRSFRGKRGDQTVTFPPFLACFERGDGKEKRGGIQKDLVSEALQIFFSLNYSATKAPYFEVLCSEPNLNDFLDHAFHDYFPFNFYR
jgi:hypothetical protein